MEFAIIILPVFLTILCGYGLAASNFLPADQWEGIEVLSFRLLIPAVLILAIAGSDLSVARFGSMVGALLGTVTIVSMLLLVFRRILPQSALDNPSFTTLFQTSTRWNGFVALAVAEQVGGAEGILLVAVAMAVLIPLINIANIIVLAGFGPGKTSAGSIALMVAKNPLVQGCAIGLGLNLTGTVLPAPIEQTLDFIGRAALGVGLLAVGAGVTMARLMRGSSALWVGLLFRPLIAPVIFVALAGFAGLAGLQLVIGALVLTVPAASNGYIVARRMGGNAGLYADILTWQSLLSVLTLPGLLYFLM